MFHISGKFQINSYLTSIWISHNVGLKQRNCRENECKISSLRRHGEYKISPMSAAFKEGVLLRHFTNHGAIRIHEFTISRFHKGFFLFSRITNDIVFTISRTLFFNFTIFTNKKTAFTTSRTPLGGLFYYSCRLIFYSIWLKWEDAVLNEFYFYNETKIKIQNVKKIYLL